MFRFLFRLSFPLFLVLILLPFRSPAQNEIERERSSLRGINALGFTVNIEAGRSLAQKADIRPSAVIKPGKEKLQTAGLRIIEDRQISDSGEVPFLYMHINMLDMGDGLVPFSVEIRFYQPVKLTLNRDMTTSASTWETGMVGLVSYDMLHVIRDSAVDLLQVFIDDYNRVNN